MSRDVLQKNGESTIEYQEDGTVNVATPGDYIVDAADMISPIVVPNDDSDTLLETDEDDVVFLAQDDDDLPHNRRISVF